MIILAGKTKTGKSYFALGLANAVASGGFALGKIKVEQGDVLYLALDKDTKRKIKGRLSNMLNDERPPDKLLIATPEDEWPKAEQGLKEIEKWIEGTENPRLVVIDTFEKFWPSSDKGGYGRDVSAAGAISDLGNEYGISILVVHHFTQRKLEEGEDWVNQLQFTEGFVASTDAVIGLFKKRGSTIADLMITGNEIEDQKYVVHLDITHFTWTLPGDATISGLSPERSAIVKVCVDFSEGKPVGPKEVATRLEKNESTIRTLMSKMAEMGQLTTNGTGGYWKSTKPEQMQFPK